MATSTPRPQANRSQATVLGVRDVDAPEPSHGQVRVYLNHAWADIVYGPDDDGVWVLAQPDALLDYVRFTQRRCQRCLHHHLDGPRGACGEHLTEDRPLDHDGHVYLVARDVSSMGELDSIVTAYVEHSQSAGVPAVVAQRRALDTLTEA